MQTVVGSTIHSDYDISLFEEINLAIWQTNLLFEGVQDGRFFFVRIGQTVDPERLGRNVIHLLMNMENDDIDELLNDTAIVIMDPQKSISRTEAFSLLIEPAFLDPID